MILYELAKQLKDAGFPQKEITPLRTREAMDYEEDIVVTYSTLSELIEACGERFSSLSRSPRNTWYVAEVKEGSQVELVRDIECSTPEEAVARLYIALNKK